MKVTLVSSLNTSAASVMADLMTPDDRLPKVVLRSHRVSQAGQPSECDTLHAVVDEGQYLLQLSVVAGDGNQIARDIALDLRGKHGVDIDMGLLKPSMSDLRSLVHVR